MSVRVFYFIIYNYVNHTSSRTAVFHDITRWCHSVTFRESFSFSLSLPKMANPPSSEDNQNDDERPQKRIKITASNGRRILRQMNSRLDKADISKYASRRVGTKGKLARLVSLPLDLLFEVSSNFNYAFFDAS
jgi:hypothetical protein